MKTNTESGISVLPSVYDEEDKDGRKNGFDDGIQSRAELLLSWKAVSPEGRPLWRSVRDTLTH